MISNIGFSNRVIQFFQDMIIKNLKLPLILFLGLHLQISHADTVKILEWNISGNELNGNVTNQSTATNIFNTESADIIVLQETSFGAGVIAAILAGDYNLLIAIDGQEIWLVNNGRFQVDRTGTWPGLCNGRALDGAIASIRDLNSNANLLHVYSAHFCIPDTFAGNVDTNPAISNEDQQEHICNIINQMEADATSGIVVLAADFNNINIPQGESIIGFLEGNGTLNAGFCTDTNINMIDFISTDVTHIMGTSGPNAIIGTAIGNPSFGQHGYVVASIELSESPSGAEGESGTTIRYDGESSTAIITGRVTIDGGDDNVDSVRNIDHIEISCNILPESGHVNLTGDLYIVVAYNGKLYSKSSSNSFTLWNGNLDDLNVYRSNVNLDADIAINVFSGQLINLFGKIDIYCAYAWQNFIYYNLTPITVEVVP